MKGQILSKTTCCYVQFFRRDELRSEVMESIYSFNLISILVVNILFFCSGICLNSLVIVSFWRSVQLRKKLCYFMIMVLSSCDLLVVLTNHPVTSLLTMPNIVLSTIFNLIRSTYGPGHEVATC